MKFFFHGILEQFIISLRLGTKSIATRCIADRKVINKRFLCSICNKEKRFVFFSFPWCIYIELRQRHTSGKHNFEEIEKERKNKNCISVMLDQAQCSIAIIITNIKIKQLQTKKYTNPHWLKRFIRSHNARLWMWNEQFLLCIWFFEKTKI